MKNYTLETRIEDLKAELGMTNYKVNCFKNSGIYNINDILSSIRSNKLPKVRSVSKKSISEIYSFLINNGFNIPDVIKSRKVLAILDCYENDMPLISSCTRNYLIYSFCLKPKEIDELEKLLEKEGLKFKEDDIVDAGLEESIANRLYEVDVETVSDLKILYYSGDLLGIRGIGSEKMKKIKEFLKINN